MSLGAIYAETRRRITDIVASLPPQELAAKLPTCPEWSSRDVVGHLTGLLADVRAGNVPAGGVSSAWTQAQVDAYADRTLGEVLADWDALAGEIEADFEGALGDAAVRVISDAYTHEHDIRGAIGRPGARDAAALAVALDFQLGNLAQRLTAAGLPALRVRAGGLDRVVGDGAAAGTVTFSSEWELQRALMARRSRAQVAALPWEAGDAERYLDAFFRFDPPAHDIVEG